MTSWAVAQLGARMHYAVPRILHEAGILDRFYTDICAAKGWPRFLRLIPPPFRPGKIQRLMGRVPRGIPKDRIIAFTSFGIEYARRRAAAASLTETTGVHLWAGDRFNGLILGEGFHGIGAVYGFNSACRRLFERAKDLRLHTVMEQTIAPRSAERRILEKEYAQHPDWAEREHDANADRYAEREKEEWELADTIICGSEFVKEQIRVEGGPAEKCLVVPYGVELSDFAVTGRLPRNASRPLRVLFVGGVGIRKGVHYLLAAMRLLEDLPVRCRVVGAWNIDRQVLLSQATANVELAGPVPRSQIAREYANADVFCLPSLCEGSATVIYEALAAGLPVITTPNAGSIVRDGIEGFIVPVCNAEALADCVHKLAMEKSLLQRMSRAASERSRYGSLSAYGDRLIRTLESVPG